MVKKGFIEQSPNRTLARSLLILETIGEQKDDRGIRELSRDLGINPATVYRVVATLEQAGYLKQDPATQRYSLGAKVMKLASQYAHKNPLPNAAQAIFEKYKDQFEHNFYLGTLNNFEVVYLAVLDGRGPVKVVVDAGGTTALHSTALGKVLLASQDDEFIHAFLEQSQLDAYTSRSITDPRKLWEQIEEIRVREFAVNNGEHYEDVGAVGVPVADPNGSVQYGVSLAYPRHLINTQRLSIETLVQLAHKIAGEIALRVSPPFLDR
jgi:DNA-binding IclR family transcriptional regulator